MTHPPVRGAPVSLGRGVAVTFSLLNWRMDCEWSPEMPTGEGARALLPAYLRARHVFLERVSESLGVKVLCVDAGGGA